MDDGASLKVNSGGQTNAISANSGSSVSVVGGSVSASSSAPALSLGDSTATLSQASVVNTSGAALALNRAAGNFNLSSSSAQVANSTLSGAGAALITFAGADLTLANTQVNATRNGTSMLNSGIGGTLFGGNVSATNGTHIAGDTNGLLITAERQTNVNWTTNLNLDQSTIEGRSGAAIVVDSVVPSFPSATANLMVANGSNLIGGNGNLLEVNHGNTANLTVDNSVLNGNVVVDNSSAATVTLQKSAVLTGQLTNVGHLAVNSAAMWNMVDNASVANVSLGGGTINLSQSGGPFHRLDVGELSGSGTFGMHVDLASLQGDFLNLFGTASGNHGLAIQNTGIEPRKGAAPLQVVQTSGGDATFQAVGNGGMVDAGTFKYTLEQEGSGWYLVQAQNEEGNPILTPSASAVLGLFNATPTIWYGEEASLRSRMGELRFGNSSGGVWARSYGSRINVDGRAGQPYQQTQYGLSVGADRSVPIANGKLLVGVLGGYSRNDLAFGSSTNGAVDSFYLGSYATWLGSNGYYLDGVLKGNVFRSDAKVTMSDGTIANGSYTNYGLGMSLEFGRLFELANNWFIEPSTRLSAFTASGTTTKLDNGLEAAGRPAKSLQARIGATLGRNLELSNGGKMQPYVKLGLVQEFAHGNVVNINDNRFDNDLSGTRLEVVAGFAALTSKTLQVHGEVLYSKGAKLTQPWGVNIGLRYLF
ncbi:autotransporter outer membrane beta-barrel domain-containing protein [Burkholderia sp. BDU5]|uniref:autotransporter outer membrane beta-barrel domain-containing protein n=1 Tax=Burkholderia sp. BDU5 TaxID=1385590 RepID=UPI001E4137FA|nr:autotransporter outer membrane beta-barrel domain-containing protein [Burkholderia sp. BDU5]